MKNADDKEITDQTHILEHIREIYGKAWEQKPARE